MAQLVEILLCGRQGPMNSTLLIPWLLMTWRRKEPGHQQPWYWPISWNIWVSVTEGSRGSADKKHKMGPKANVWLLTMPAMGVGSLFIFLMAPGRIPFINLKTESTPKIIWWNLQHSTHFYLPESGVMFTKFPNGKRIWKMLQETWKIWHLTSYSMIFSVFQTNFPNFTKVGLQIKTA